MDNYYFHMDNLSVGYNRKALIHDICIGIKKGEIVTLIGPNGSGKSTVMKLLQGFYQPDSGEIWVGGNKICETSPQECHKKFGYVLQNNPLMSGTIRDNILYGTEGETPEEEMKKAAREARADSFIDALPNGYDTTLGEAGEPFVKRSETEDCHCQGIDCEAGLSDTRRGGGESGP